MPASKCNTITANAAAKPQKMKTSQAKSTLLKLNSKPTLLISPPSIMLAKSSLPANILTLPYEIFDNIVLFLPDVTDILAFERAIQPTNGGLASRIRMWFEKALKAEHGDEWPKKVFWESVRVGKPNLVILMLDEYQVKVDISITDPNVYCATTTALSWLCQMRHWSYDSKLHFGSGKILSLKTLRVCFRALLERGANVNVMVGTACLTDHRGMYYTHVEELVQYLAKKGDIELLKIVMPHLADLRPALLAASSVRDNSQTVRFFFSRDKKLDVNAQDQNNHTSLWHAIAAGGCESTIEALLLRHADFDKVYQQIKMEIPQMHQKQRENAWGYRPQTILDGLETAFEVAKDLRIVSGKAAKNGLGWIRKWDTLLEDLPAAAPVAQML